MLFRIRPAGGEDVAVIAEIEQAAPSAWPASQIELELQQLNGISLIVCSEADACAAGWCCARYCPPEAELLKIAVIPRYRRSGAASRLLAELFREIVKRGCSEIFLEVRRNNLPAQELYRKIGFFELALRKSYYRDPPDDGIVFKKYI